MGINGFNYAWPITSVNSLDYEAFKKWMNNYSDIIYNKEVVIFGAGIRGTSFLKFFEIEGVHNIVFIDNNKEKVGGNIDGSPIISVDEALERVRLNKSIIVISTENYSDIVDQLEKHGLLRDRDFYTINTNEYKAYVDEFMREYDCKYLFMGDCEYSNISLHDIDRRNLAEMLKDEFGFQCTKVLAMHGMHLRSQFNIFEQQIQIGQIPEYLFLMINLDTLTGKQHLLPRSQHSALLNMIWEACGRNKDFGEYVGIITEREKKVKAEFLIKGKKMTNESLRMAQHINYFRLNYMYKMEPDVEGLAYIREFSKLCKVHAIKLIPFIPPVNYQYAEKLIHEEFLVAYEYNRNILAKLFNDNKLCAMDFSFVCGAEMFAESDTPDETTNERGRLLLVRKFREEIEKYEK